MSRPKFQSQDARTAARLGREPLGPPTWWSFDSAYHRAALTAIRLPPEVRPYYDVEGAVRRSLGRQHHYEYLKRTGGNVRTEIEDVPLMYTCCGREEVLAEVHYDRHGNLRPEDEALIRARSYYHRCADA